MKWLPPFALGLLLTAVFIAVVNHRHTVEVTAVPLSERQAIMVWCAVHNQTPGPPTQAYLRSCTETNTP